MHSNHSTQSDQLNWLLEEDHANPGVRYFALRELLGLPGEDAQVREAQASLMQRGPVSAILAAQKPKGYWGRSGGGHSPSYTATVWQLIFLAELGADGQDERVRKGCEYFLEKSQAPNGGFSMKAQNISSGVVHCMSADPLFALLRFGYADDERVQAALRWQIGAILGDEDVRFYKSATSGKHFECGYNRDQACAWGASKALKAFAELPSNYKMNGLQEAIAVGVGFLLDNELAEADYPFSGKVSAAWFKFGFPLSYRGDILETAYVLTKLGYGTDPRLLRAQQFIAEKQDEEGRWIMEQSFNGKMWADIEEKGQPSKWLTLRALRTLQELQAMPS